MGQFTFASTGLFRLVWFQSLRKTKRTLSDIGTSDGKKDIRERKLRIIESFNPYLERPYGSRLEEAKRNMARMGISRR